MHDWWMSLGLWLENSSVAYAAVNWSLLGDILTISHFFSFFLVVGTTAAVDLRLLGLVARDHSASQLAEQLFPWTGLLWGTAVLSGLMMFVPSATTFFNSSFFFIKLLVTVLATAFVPFIQWNVRKWDQSGAIPALAKLMAAVSLMLWIGAILGGTHVPVQTCQ